ncbi:DUF2177 family protein [Hoeflea prorocentri]|uniref:DUF2177 family protein n=1 Tax=Hoeflea prorocentri TaxID=1922333 RepID=A0A9X3UKI3_9HYPH|nr:DUF2177 family protein [Hoeflea prorocentri]MCY6382222.1 DUF2177 family protein [Hoeflea prorocentri]MDA5400022.1 DUF2177 family protein [Hoeflea prorocentri]
MVPFLKTYLVTAIVFLAVDYVWLARVAGGFYRTQLGAHMLDQPRLGVAAVFYIFYVAGIVVFAVLPAMKEQSLLMALLLGGLLGGVAYGTYDVTNYATLRNWPLAVLVVDISWGIVLTSVSAAAGYTITRML